MSSLSVILIIGLLTLVLALLADRALKRPRMATLQDLDALFNDGPDRYTHLSRVLGPGDFEFLAGSRHGSAVLKPFRRRRLHCMRGYLTQMRQEFDSLMALGSLFAAAPTAQAENFASRLLKQRLTFYLLLAGVHVRLAADWLFPAPPDIGSLAEQLRSLRYQADRMLRALTPEDLGALRNVLRAG